MKMRSAECGMRNAESSVAASQQPSICNRVLAIDPGRAKCGLAVVARDGTVVARRVTLVAEVRSLVLDWAREFQISCIVLGDSTTSREWQGNLAAWLPQAELFLVDESGSTLEARTLYWQAHPPRGWRRLVPLSLQAPPAPIDDYAAVVLARRFFERVKG